MKMSKKQALYIVEDRKNAQFRYRVYNIKQLFSDDKEWNVEYKLINQISDRLFFTDADLIIIARQSAKNNNVIRIIDEAHKQKKKVLFDLDDLVFDYKYLPLLMKSTNSRNIFYWMGYFWGIRRIAKKVDGFLCTNDFLAKKIEESFRKPVKVIPNSLNNEQVDVSNQYLNNKKKGTFVIGYFSGSPTHTVDFRMVEPELISFLDKYEDAFLLIVGYMNYSKQIRELISSGRVRVVPPVDYLKLQRLMSEVDVNIAPLVLNDFTNCKSELKYFEAAIVETTTIASPNYSFSNAINSGQNGFLASNGEEWFEILENLYNDRKNNRRVAKNARQNALSFYYGEKIKRQVLEAYDFFTV